MHKWSLKPVLTTFTAFRESASEVGQVTETVTVTGTVRDSTGAVVPGAEVTLINSLQGNGITATTNDVGTYCIAG